VPSPINSYITINQLDSEWKSTGWYANVNTIYDPTNRIYGEVRYHIVEAFVGTNNARFSKNGGANIAAYPTGATNGIIYHFFRDGGVSHGNNTTIGTNDNFSLTVETNNTPRAIYGNDGSFRLIPNATSRYLFDPTGLTDGTWTSNLAIGALNSAESAGANFALSAANIWLRPIGTTTGVLISRETTGVIPNALLQLGAGSTVRAPFKFTSGTNLTTPQAGAIEYDGSDFFGSDATRREKFIRGYKGSGTPEAAVTAPVGSIFQRSDGGAGTSFYVKQSGTGNTGWAGIGVAANLGYTTDAVTGTITNTGGTTATIPAATDLIAGLLTASDYVALQALKNTRVGLASGTTDGSGDLVITFSSALPNATYSIVITPEGTTSMEYSIIAKTTTTATVRFYGSTTGLALASTAVTVNYNAKDY